MLKQLNILILSYLLLITTATAGTSKENFINKMEVQTTSIFNKANHDLSTKTEAELTESYGDYVLGIFYNSEETVATLGLSLKAPISENLERIFSPEGKELILKNLERAIDNAGSVKKFKKAAKRKLKNLEKDNIFTTMFNGVAYALQTVFLVITFPIWFPLLLLMLNEMG